MSEPTHTQVPDPVPNLTRTADGVSANLSGQTLTPGGPGETSPPVAGPVVVPPGFEVLGELGRGGMGVVYKARQTALNRLVAIKMIPGPGAEAHHLVRFLVEAEAVASIRHPHVVQVYDFGEYDGRPFMALEYLPGGTLSGRLDRGRLAPADAAALVAKLAGAVQAAHDAGIVHRDLKPGNVLFDDTGEPKITDFGIAKRGQSDLTRTQAVLGTPAYMAPEQAKGETKFVGPAADIYALGVILYECLTGTRPFDGDESWSVLHSVIDTDPDPLRKRVPTLPRDLDLICLKCLAKRPAERYPSAAALADDLRQFLDGRPVSVRPAGPGERLTKWARRNPTVAALLAALAVVTAVGFAGVTVGFVRAETRSRDLQKANADLTEMWIEYAALTRDLTRSRNDLARAEGEARRRAAEAEYQGYLSDIALAYQYWKANDLRGMREALARCPPPRRKWEWHYLDRLSRPIKEDIDDNEIPVDVAYSPDGSLLAWVGDRGGVTARDRAAGTNKFRVPPPNDGGGFPALVFRPDGKELAYISRGGLGVLDLTTGESRAVTDPGKQDAEFVKQFGLGVEDRAITFTPDGRLLVAGLTGAQAARIDGPKKQPRKVVVRDVTAGTTVGSFTAFEDVLGYHFTFGGVAFSPDGRRLAASVVTSGARSVVAMPPGGPKLDPERVKKWEEEGAAADAEFRPFTAVWEIESGKLLRQVPTGGARQRQVAFDRAGSRVAVGDGRRVVVFAPTTADPPEVREHHTGGVFGVAFGPDGAVWSGAEDRRVCGVVRGTADVRDELRGCPNPVVRLAVSPDGSEVVAATYNLFGGVGRLHRFEVGGSRDAWRFAGGERIGLVVAVSPDATRVATLDGSLTARDDFRFLVRDLRSGTERRAEKPGPWFSGVFLPDGGVVVPTTGKALLVLDRDARRVRELPLPVEGSGFGPAAVGCTADGAVALAAIGLAGNAPAPGILNEGLPRLRLATWDVASGQAGRTFDLDLAPLLPAGARGANVIPLGCAASPDGRRAAVAGLFFPRERSPGGPLLRGVVVVWDLASGTELFRRVTDEPARSVGFDPDGRLVVTGGSASAGGELTCWELATKTEVFKLRGHAHPILAAAFGPDSRIATAGADRVVKVWDTATGREVLTIDGFAREVTHVRFTKDGRDLVAGTGLDMVPMLTSVGGPPERVWPPAEVRVFRSAR
jgi:WD40 repeat protein